MLRKDLEIGVLRSERAPTAAVLFGTHLVFYLPSAQVILVPIKAYRIGKHGEPLADVDHPITKKTAVAVINPINGKPEIVETVH